MFKKTKISLLILGILGLIPSALACGDEAISEILGVGSSGGHMGWFTGISGFFNGLIVGLLITAIIIGVLILIKRKEKGGKNAN